MKKILIVDDSAFMRGLIISCLKTLGYTDFEESSDGYSAIEKFKQVSPDLVILDITMLNLDGLEVLRQIKQIDKDAKVIMCSAMGQESIVIEAITIGAIDFIVKPFNIDKMSRIMESVFGD